MAVGVNELQSAIVAIETKLGVNAANVAVLAVANTFVSGQKISGNAGSSRSWYFQTAGVNRWELRINTVAESGGNAGSDLNLLSYADNGSYITNPVTITRSTAAFGLSGAFGCNAATPQSAYAVGAAASDPATTMALVNLLRTALLNNGIAKVA